MRRRLLNLVTALSLLLCVAVVALWVRSYGVCERLVHERVDAQDCLNSVAAASCRGAVLFKKTCLDTPIPFPPAPGIRHMRDDAGALNRAGLDVVAGFGLGRYRYRLLTTPTESPERSVWGTARVLLVPYYALTMLTALLPLARARRVWVRRSRPPGHCPRCGYDLRATPGRCPECGTATL